MFLCFLLPFSNAIKQLNSSRYFITRIRDQVVLRDLVSQGGNVRSSSGRSYWPPDRSVHYVYPMAPYVSVKKTEYYLCLYFPNGITGAVLGVAVGDSMPPSPRLGLNEERKSWRLSLFARHSPRVKSFVCLLFKAGNRIVGLSSSQVRQF